MLIDVIEAQGQVPVTIVRLQGSLDSFSYRDLIDRAKEVYTTGARDMLLDLSETTYVSSAGLVAMQIIARLLRGEGTPEEEDGWSALRSIERDRETGFQKHFKLLNPSPQVIRVLETAGLKEYFQAFTDYGEAVASF